MHVLNHCYYGSLRTGSLNITLILIQHFVKADVFASFLEALIRAIKGNMTAMIRLLVYTNLYLPNVYM